MANHRVLRARLLYHRSGFGITSHVPTHVSSYSHTHANISYNDPRLFARSERVTRVKRSSAANPLPRSSWEKGVTSCFQCYVLRVTRYMLRVTRYVHTMLRHFNSLGLAYKKHFISLYFKSEVYLKIYINLKDTRCVQKIKNIEDI